MKPTLVLLMALLPASLAGAGEVYVTRDAQGNRVYTDMPATLPATKLDIRNASSDPAEAQARYDQQMKQYAADDAAPASSSAADVAKARQLTAEDRARRCTEARQRYEAYMASFRLYEVGPDGERRYLTAEEIDSGRASAKQVMDEFCGGQ